MSRGLRAALLELYLTQPLALAFPVGRDEVRMYRTFECTDRQKHRFVEMGERSGTASELTTGPLCCCILWSVSMGIISCLDGTGLCDIWALFPSPLPPQPGRILPGNEQMPKY